MLRILPLMMAAALLGCVSLGKAQKLRADLESCNLLEHLCQGNLDRAEAERARLAGQLWSCKRAAAELPVCK